jgi:hypothetical protein
MPDTDPKYWSMPTLLDREADARFWAQSHYKVGRKLDPRDPTDRAMAKIWRDVRAKVGAEDRAGRLILTYDNPHVVRRLGDAKIASQAADAHVGAAIDEPDLAAAGRHAIAAAIAAAAAAMAAHDAASVQPPTVSPIVADSAAQEAAASAGIQIPDPISPSLPPGHPATSEAAGPVLHPDAAQDPDPMPPESSSGEPGIGLSSPLPSERGAAQLNLARALNAPSVAVSVHERAASRQATLGQTAKAADPTPVKTSSKIAAAVAVGAGVIAIGAVVADRAHRRRRRA